VLTLAGIALTVLTIVAAVLMRRSFARLEARAVADEAALA
jgi:hypothetical protein